MSSADLVALATVLGGFVAGLFGARIRLWRVCARCERDLVRIAKARATASRWLR
jgi:hypothetical protein